LGGPRVVGAQATAGIQFEVGNDRTLQARENPCRYVPHYLSSPLVAPIWPPPSTFSKRSPRR